ncbi:hypothetical protein [Arthrobacter oryzae]|uniref:hypothetical protein n=1 Tax=Arthrobacter oryzae TaxID=409290 RepID=UPI00273BBA74|nr:hypothetical protein [Arthrobacter oryzae]WLQ05823.1 hypothetical protein Q8Z05_17170 [Arthrobacter oryzae]
MNQGTQLEAVRPGDVLILQRSRFRVLSSQHDADLVTLELDDEPEQPMILIGVPSMPVVVEAGRADDSMAEDLSAGPAA